MIPVKEQIEEIGSVLQNAKRPLKERFRALFTLKNIGGDESVKQICAAFADDSALLKHELAYCLGQMQNISAVPKLTEVLSDLTQEPMVRHECGNSQYYNRNKVSRWFVGIFEKMSELSKAEKDFALKKHTRASKLRGEFNKLITTVDHFKPTWRSLKVGFFGKRNAMVGNTCSAMAKSPTNIGNSNLFRLLLAFLKCN
ncbi:DOHH family protein [Megaselia abdita]